MTGQDGEVHWKVLQHREREFMILVKKGNEAMHDYYKCEYPTIIGLDVVDHSGLNQKLDEMIEKMRVK